MIFLKNIFKNIFNILFVIVILALVTVAFSYFQMKINNQKYANLFGYSFFEVKTGSMSHTIEINDVIVVKNNADFKENDIITFIDKNDIVTHRLISITNDLLITKGDANNEKDKPIKQDSVIGKVVLIIPKFGIWIKVFTDFKVIISILITIVLFGEAFSDKKQEEHIEETTFSKFMRKRREKRHGKDKKKNKS